MCVGANDIAVVVAQIAAIGAMNRAATRRADDDRRRDDAFFAGALQRLFETRALIFAVADDDHVALLSRIGFDEPHGSEEGATEIGAGIGDLAGLNGLAPRRHPSIITRARRPRVGPRF